MGTVPMCGVPGWLLRSAFRDAPSAVERRKLPTSCGSVRLALGTAFPAEPWQPAQYWLYSAAPVGGDNTVHQPVSLTYWNGRIDVISRPGAGINQTAHSPNSQECTVE